MVTMMRMLSLAASQLKPSIKIMSQVTKAATLKRELYNRAGNRNRNDCLRWGALSVAVELICNEHIQGHHLSCCALPFLEREVSLPTLKCFPQFFTVHHC